jgi:hypothetical protein
MAATPPPPVAELKEPRQAFKSTHFEFEHKVFSVEGSYFAVDANSGSATFYVPLGDIHGVLSLAQLMNGFNLAGTKDADLLQLVERGLQFVRRIHPGDSIPSEILDGSASWSVDDRHRMIAESRLRVLLGTWIAGKEAQVRDVSELLKMANDPDIRDKMQEAVTAIAEKLGLGRERRVEVLDRVDKLGRELSYIEALRDRFAAVKMIVMKLGQLQALYGPERGFAEEVKRVLVLMRKPISDFDRMFTEVDGQTSEIVSVLANFESQVRFIRETRDALHGRFMPWDELITRWQEQPVEIGTPTEGLLRATYRFMARHFSQDETWNLQFGQTAKPATPGLPRK